MKTEEFEALYLRTKAEHPIWFALESDPPATTAEIESIQSGLGVSFPEEYVVYVSRYGGGFFGFVTVYSVATSSFNILEINRNSSIPSGFLAFSDNGSGDYYCFKVINGQCTSPVYFLDHETGYVACETEFSDLFEFLAQKALNPG